MTNSLFIGVDVSLQSNQICVLNFDQHKFFNLKFPNTPDGCENAIERIKSLFVKLLVYILFIQLVIFLLMNILITLIPKFIKLMLMILLNIKTVFLMLKKLILQMLIFLPTLRELVELSLYILFVAHSILLFSV